MVVKRLHLLVAASAWLPTAYSTIAKAGEPETIWTSPAQTLAKEGGNPAAPAPTSPPRLEDRVVVEKRQNGDNTCGYFNGNPSQKYECAAAGAVCLYNERAKAVGCCYETGCNIYTACLPYSSSRLSVSLNMDVTRYCSDPAKPYCATLVYADPEWIGYTIPTCYSEPTSMLIYYSAFGAGASAGSTGPAITIPTNPITSQPGPTSPGPTRSPIDDTPEISDETARKIGIGIIVGIAIGALSFIALIGLLIFFCLRRRSRRKQNIQPPLPVPAPLQTAPPPAAGIPQQPIYSAAPLPPKQDMAAVPNAQFVGTYPTIDNRPSNMGKPTVEHSVSPVPSPSPASPPPMYAAPPPALQQQQQQQQQQQYFTSPLSPQQTGQFAQPISPQQTGQFAQPVSPQYTGQAGIPQPVSPQVTGQTAVPAQAHPPYNPHLQFIAELPTQKGDGQVHEAP